MTAGSAGSRRMRTALARAGLVAVSTVLTLTVLELVARISESRLEARAASRAGPHEVSADEPLRRGKTWARVAGHRYRDLPIEGREVDESTIRILFLGDSFTAGSGLQDLRARFVERTTAALNRESPNGVRVDSFDAAVGGSMPESWLADYEAVAPRYRPQIVVAVFFMRDGTSLGTSYRQNFEKFQRLESKLDPLRIRRHSALARYFIDRWSRSLFSDYLKEEVLRSYLGTEAERAVWLRQQGALVRLAELCGREGRDFRLVLFPLLFELRDDPFSAAEDEVRDFAQRSGIEFFSLTPGFLGRDASELWVSPQDQHPNERGHLVAAQALLPYLREVVRSVEAREAEARRAPSPRPPPRKGENHDQELE